MKKIFLLISITFILITFFSNGTSSSTITWQKLQNGLEYALIDAAVKSSHGDSKIDILRFDPKKFKLNLLCAAEKKTKSKTMDLWCKENNAIAGINAGMFQLSGSFDVCTGYMKNYNYVNNPILTSSYKNILAFNPKDSLVPPIQIIDITCANWSDLKNKYNSFAQGIRMMDCNQKNTWKLQEKKWSMVTIGEDQGGNILFIFSRSPYKVHDYINMLKSTPLHLKKMMYLEGGPEASFYLKDTALSVQRCGSYETDFNENDSNKVYWDIPNVLALSKK